MSKERVREPLSRPITPDYLEAKLAQGWTPVAIEWERDRESEGGTGMEVPYGLEIAGNRDRLVTNEEEMGCLRAMLAEIVQDRSMSEVAEELNRRGFRRRDGSSWSQSSVFEMLPRVIEVAPSIYDSEAWKQERRHLRKIVG
ncbi:MAG: recombinase family protein [Holophagales bacterium]|nr:recombinase family protein [Holophagales bacterium]